MTVDHGRVVSAATDGACSGNPGPGGWGVLMRYEDGSIEEFGGHEPSTTNNRMELQAALALLERLQELPRHPDLIIRSDSKYLINGFSLWLDGWKRKNWRTASGKPVLNQDLWQALDNFRMVDVSFTYVKGHSGDPDNDRVDQIAVGFSKRIPPTLKTLEKDPSFLSTTSSNKKLKKLSERVFSGSDSVSVNLQRLLSRLELADQFAKHGYGLSVIELAELVDESLPQIKQRQSAWRWRDWLVEPLGNDFWRLTTLPSEEIEECSGE